MVNFQYVSGPTLCEPPRTNGVSVVECCNVAELLDKAGKREALLQHKRQNRLLAAMSNTGFLTTHCDDCAFPLQRTTNSTGPKVQVKMLSNGRGGVGRSGQLFASDGVQAEVRFMRQFKVGWPGERIGFEEMCKEFEQSHFAAISEGTIAGYRAYLKHMKAFFGGLVLARITTKLVEEYRDYRRQQPSIRYKGQPLKGATVNRELECLT